MSEGNKKTPGGPKEVKAIRKETLNLGGQIIARARKNLGITRKGLADMLDYTTSQIAKVEKGATQLSFDRVSKAIKTLRLREQDAALLKRTHEKARHLSREASGGAIRAWQRLSETEKSRLTRDMMELGGYVPGAEKPPTQEEKVLFAVRTADDDGRRFRRILDVLEVDVSQASKIITKALEAEFGGKKKKAPARKKPAARKPAARRPAKAAG